MRVKVAQCAGKLLRFFHSRVTGGWTFAHQMGHETLSRDCVDFDEYVRRRAEHSRISHTRVKAWRRFVNEYLNLFSCELLVIFIDDADVSQKLCTDLIHTIRMYLSHPRIVLVLALDRDTLRDSLEIEKLKDIKPSLDVLFRAHDMSLAKNNNSTNLGWEFMQKAQDYTYRSIDEVGKALDKVLSRQNQFDIVDFTEQDLKNIYYNWRILEYYKFISAKLKYSDIKTNDSIYSANNSYVRECLCTLMFLKERFKRLFYRTNFREILQLRCILENNVEDLTEAILRLPMFDILKSFKKHLNIKNLIVELKSTASLYESMTFELDGVEKSIEKSSVGWWQLLLLLDLRWSIGGVQAVEPVKGISVSHKRYSLLEWVKEDTKKRISPERSWSFGISKILMDNFFIPRNCIYFRDLSLIQPVRVVDEISDIQIFQIGEWFVHFVSYHIVQDVSKFRDSSFLLKSLDQYEEWDWFLDPGQAETNMHGVRLMGRDMNVDYPVYGGFYFRLWLVFMDSVFIIGKLKEVFPGDKVLLGCIGNAEACKTCGFTYHVDIFINQCLRQKAPPKWFLSFLRWVRDEIRIDLARKSVFNNVAKNALIIAGVDEDIVKLDIKQAIEAADQMFVEDRDKGSNDLIRRKILLAWALSPLVGDLMSDFMPHSQRDIYFWKDTLTKLRRWLDEASTFKESYGLYFPDLGTDYVDKIVYNARADIALATVQWEWLAGESHVAKQDAIFPFSLSSDIQVAVVSDLGDKQSNGKKCPDPLPISCFSGEYARLELEPSEQARYRMKRLREHRERFRRERLMKLLRLGFFDVERFIREFKKWFDEQEPSIFVPGSEVKTE
ncbi:MAG: hypothetical protein HQL74_15195 [Magnetococcales bacterium]|nr:hypothetical protein [Magnetococcales bacterium]